MQFLSNMADTCCELAIVLTNYIVDSYGSLGRLGSGALKLLIVIVISTKTHSLHAAAKVSTVVCTAP